MVAAGPAEPGQRGVSDAGPAGQPSIGEGVVRGLFGFLRAVLDEFRSLEEACRRRTRQALRGLGGIAGSGAENRGTAEVLDEPDGAR